MMCYDFEDWNGYTLHAENVGGVIDWYGRDADAVSLVEMRIDAVPNLIAWLYGQLDDEARGKVLEGALSRIARRLVQVNAGKVLA